MKEQFCMLNYREINFLLCPTCSPPEGNEEDQYIFDFGYQELYRDFDDSKALYLLFVRQLIKFYAESLRISRELDYVYATIFRISESGTRDIRARSLHQGFFSEIVLSEERILNAFIIAYMGLEKYTANFPVIQQMKKNMKEIWIDRLQYCKEPDGNQSKMAPLIEQDWLPSSPFQLPSEFQLPTKKSEETTKKKRKPRKNKRRKFKEQQKMEQKNESCEAANIFRFIDIKQITSLMESKISPEQQTAEAEDSDDFITPEIQELRKIYCPDTNIPKLRPKISPHILKKLEKTLLQLL